MSAPTDRRTFLRGFAKLPLIGGTLAIVGAPSAPVSLVQAATLAGVADPHERARYAWEAFTSAMDEVAADLDGWFIRGGSRLTSIPGLAASTWGSLNGSRYIYDYSVQRWGGGPGVFEENVDLGLTL